MTTNADNKAVPSFWQKWWNALKKPFQRNPASAAAGQNQSPSGGIAAPSIGAKSAGLTSASA